MSRTDHFLRVDDVEQMPEYADLEPHVLYRCEPYGLTGFLCPCGCGLNVSIPTKHPEDDRGWSYERHEDGTLTLSPSIEQRGGCKSHYYIRRNRVEWC